jgi:acyl carrier protein
MTREELLDFIKQEIATETGSSKASVDENASFHSLGLDSLSAVLILHNIERKYGIELNPIHFWDYPTPAAFADFTVKKHSR